jgi:hypothetical protein
MIAMAQAKAVALRTERGLIGWAEAPRLVGAWDGVVCTGTPCRFVFAERMTHPTKE